MHLLFGDLVVHHHLAMHRWEILWCSFQMIPNGQDRRAEESGSLPNSFLQGFKRQVR